MAMYGIPASGNLLWHFHDGRDDGSQRWTGPKVVGLGGWDGYRSIIGARNGILYGVDGTGKLWWYRHDGWVDGTMRWQGRIMVGNGGWNQYKTVFAGIEGTIYGVGQDGNLWWYRHDGRLTGTSEWTGRRLVGGGGWEQYKFVFAGGGGSIYAVGNDGKLWWYRHDGWHDGTQSWSGRTLIGNSGWADYVSLFAGRGNDIYAVSPNGDLWWYRHLGAGDGSSQWMGRNLVGKGGWQQYRSITVVGHEIGDNFTFDPGITVAQRVKLLERHRFAHSRIMQCANIAPQRISLINAYHRQIDHGIETRPNTNGSAFIGGNQLFVNFNVLFPQGDVEIAQTLIHEMMHCAGFGHPTRRDPPPGMSCANPNPALFDCAFDNGQYYGTPPLQAEMCIAGSQSDLTLLKAASDATSCEIDSAGRATIRMK